MESRGHGRLRWFVFLVPLMILVFLCLLRWPSDTWRKELEIDLSERIGLPVEVQSFSAGWIRPSVAKGIRVKNVAPFEDMEPMLEVTRIFFYHSFLSRFTNWMNVSALRAQGVEIRLGQLPELGWNVTPLRWSELRSRLGDTNRKFAFDMDEMKLSQVRVVLLSASGEKIPIFSDMDFHFSGFHSQGKPANLSMSSKSPQSKFTLQGTVDHRKGYALDLVEWGEFDFGEYVKSLSQDLPLEVLGLQALGVAKLEGMLRGPIEALDMKGRIDLSGVHLVVGEHFKKSAGMQGEITYDVAVLDGMLVLKELRFKDMFSGFRFSGRMDPDAETKAHLSVTSEGSDLKYIKQYVPSLERTKVDGRVDARGDFSMDSEGIHYEGSLEGMDLEVADVRVDSMMGQLSTRNREIELGKLNLRMYSGIMDILGRLSLEETNKGFELVFKLDDIDLGAISLDLMPEMGDRLGGTLHGEMNLRGPGVDVEDLRNLEGFGGVRVEQARLSGLEPVRQVLRWTGEKDVSQMTFDKVEADFDLSGEGVRIERMEMVSKLISLLASGKMDLATNLEYQAKITLASSIMAQFPRLEETESFHYDEDDQGVFLIGIRGTLIDPIIKIPPDLLMQMIAMGRNGSVKMPPLPDLPVSEGHEVSTAE